MKILITIVFCLISQLSVSQLPSIEVQSTKQESPLQMSHLTLNIEVVGNIATTTYDMTFFNPNRRDLEGALSMPLGDGKEIFSYALEINGKLREGVVVEKVKARQTFEAVVRQKIDPGIVSKTKGNFFKTKIYPIPANGSKRVVLGVVETLQGDDRNLYYAMPIGAKQSIGQFELNVNVVKGRTENISPTSAFENLAFDSREDIYNLNFKRNEYTFSKPLKFTIPRFSKSNYQLFTEEVDGTTYFYLNAKVPSMAEIIKKHPKSITIYWDRSHSASKRDLSKELDLLSKYLSGLEGTKKVTFIGFNHRESTPVEFKIASDPTALLEHIKQLKNDGATRIDQINFVKNGDEILLFSDAINTIGQATFKKAVVPVYTIVSSFGANYNLLKQISNDSKGAFIDLNQLGFDRALNLMKVNEEQLISIDYDVHAIGEVYPDSPTRVDGFVEVVGVLKTAQSTVTLNYGFQHKATKTQSFEINKDSNAPISRLWASKKIASLAWDYANNQQQILELGKKFNIVTANTSLFVLDRVEDYVAHKINPPAELQEVYDQLLALEKKEEKFPLKAIQNNNINRIGRLKSWYDNPITVAKKNKVNEVMDGSYDEIELEIEVTLDAEITEETVIEDIVFDAGPQEELDVLYETEPNSSERSISNTLQGHAAGVQVTRASESGSPSDPSNGTSIKVLAWLPDAPYMVELRKTKSDNLNQVYYKFKKENENRPSFYIQVADLYFERNLNKMAVQILLNTIEMDLENPELLKVVAKRMLDEGEVVLAIQIFEEIKNLRPEEPQSHRDLALAYAENQQCQQALDTYQFILDNEWGRFEEIKDVILMEINRLISKYENELDLKNLKTEYIKPMALDVRIIIDWSSNENDIDLWVIDPNGEKCYYSNPNTALGGKISKDFTRGYGPEEYSLKSAKRGIYTVYVNYYSESRQTISGPVTVYATLFRHYGTKQQESKRIAIQLTDNKETKQIGQLEFED